MASSRCYYSQVGWRTTHANGDKKSDPCEPSPSCWKSSGRQKVRYSAMSYGSKARHAQNVKSKAPSTVKNEQEI